MTIVFPAAHPLGTETALVDSIDGPTPDTDDFVVLADTDIGAANETSMRILFLLNKRVRSHPQPVVTSDQQPTPQQSAPPQLTITTHDTCGLHPMVYRRVNVFVYPYWPVPLAMIAHSRTL